MALDTVIVGRLLSRLAEERKKAIERMVGGALTDRMYGYTCGYIKSIDDVGVILDEIMKDLQGG